MGEPLFEIGSFLGSLYGEGAFAWSRALSPSVLPWFGGSVALIASLLLTPVVLYVARWKDWVAHPTTDRWHDRPVALLGGIGIFGAGILGIVVSGALPVYEWPVWTGVVIVFLAGLADDLWDIRPESKLIIQVIATALLLYAGHAFWRGGPFWISAPLTFLWVIGITNAVNLIDGLDGLAASVATVAATVLAVIGVLIDQTGFATVAAVLAGASIGFLVYNANPARIFMGDCGSMLLGYMLAVIALGVQGTGEPVTGTLVPIVVMAVPIFDTTFVTVTRILGGRSITKGSTDHTHHRLVRHGLSEQGAVLTLTGMSTLFGLAALAILWTTAQLFMALVLLGVVGCVVFALYLVGGRTFQPVPTREHTFTERVGAVMRAVAGGIYWKSVGGVVADLIVVVSAFILAFHLRFGGSPPPDQLTLMTRALPGIVVIKVLVFYAFGLYHGVWRHAGTPEAVRLAKASTLASVFTLAGLVFFHGLAPISPSVIILDWMIATGAVGGTRFGFRALRQYFAAQRDGGQRVLVYGSSDHGLLVLRHLRQRPERTVVGLLDEDSDRHHLRVQGVQVLGSATDLQRLASRFDIDGLIIPVRNTTEEQRQQLALECSSADVDCHYFSFQIESASGDDAHLSPSPSGDGAHGISYSPS